MEPLRFAFGFQARVGKDTAVDYFIKNYGGKRLSFAGALYDILGYAQEVCGLKKEKDRKFLQIVGTEWGRDKDPNIWVNIVVKKIRVSSPNENIFVSDVRFPNEFEALKKEGFTMILITRTDKNEILNTSHASETSLLGSESKFDFHIQNDESLEDFYKKLDCLVKKVVK